ncbi:ribonuclease H-like domain-containing protein [Tanacetum coccineum]
MGELNYFLEIEVSKTKIGLCLYQRKYRLKLLYEFVLLTCKPVLTPLPYNVVLAHKEFEGDKYLINVTNYQKLVGKLIYLTLTRPDISYVFHYLSQHMHSPFKSHFDTTLRLLKYLKLAPGNSIEFSKNQSGFSVTVFFDSDWSKCPVTKRYVSGYCVMINGCLVSWNSKKHATLSRSLADAEYRSMTAASCEIVVNPVMHKKTKHFDIDVHLVRENVSSGFDSKDNVAHILTKALGHFSMVFW